jgi:hypothetical protein
MALGKVALRDHHGGVYVGEEFGVEALMVVRRNAQGDEDGGTPRHRQLAHGGGAGPADHQMRLG